MTVKQYNSNEQSHTWVLMTFGQKNELWMNSLPYWPRLKKDLRSKFGLGPKIRTSRQAQSGIRAYSAKIHNPCAFQTRLDPKTFLPPSKFHFAVWNMTSLQRYFSTCITKSHERVAGAWCYSTLVVLVSWHHDVTFHSPGSPPRVFDQPVVLPLVGSIANNKYSVIQKPRTVAVTDEIRNKRKVRIRFSSRRVLPPVETFYRPP